MGSQGSDSVVAGEDVSATADEDERSGARSGVRGESYCNSTELRVGKRLDLRRAPLLALPHNAFSNQSAFLSSLTKDTVPSFVSISFTSRPKGLPRRPPAIDY